MAGFKEILGQDQIIRHFKGAINMNKISHAYIINGEQFSGKKMLAKAFAMALQCEDLQDGEPCLKCRSCKQAMNGNQPDIKWVTHEKTSIGVDEIREQLNGDIDIKPYSSRHKIYIIDDAQKMTEQAQNALLKTIEEPPAYAVIILLTTNSKSFLQTILSRCVVLNTRAVKDEVIKNYLMERVKVPDYEADIATAFSGGNLGKAVKIASSEDFAHLKDTMLRQVRNIHQMEALEINATAKNLTEFKERFIEYLDLMRMWYRDVLVIKSHGNEKNIIFKDEINYLQKQADICTFAGVDRIFKAIEKTENQLRANVNFEMAVEIMFLTIKERMAA